MKITTYLYAYFITLLFLGSIFVYSASSFTAFYFYKNTFYFYLKQMLAIAIGISLVFFIKTIKLEIIKKYFFYIYGIILCLNILPFIPFIKYPINGAHRWISLCGIIFQPSELLKMGYLFYNAFLVYFYYDQIKYVLLFVFLNLSFVVGILGLQSDFGLIILFSSITFLLLWEYLYHKKIFLYFLLCGMIIFVLLIYWKPYRVARIMTFIDPWHDPLGKGFQIIQSLIAIYNGGMSGVGLGLSRQKRLFLPMSHTDFIFSIVVEECGAIGAWFFLLILIYFPYQIIQSRNLLNDTWSRNYVISVGLLIIFQIIVNVSASIALLPTKGIGLPLISYGMSSVIGFSLLVGLALNVLKQCDKGS
jgi:cell division protein FtsW